MGSVIADRVREAGIVGAGGAGFPTHVKLGATADTVIGNGAECEPLLRCDKAVMRERTEDVLLGLAALAEATGARRVVLALKGHYRDLVAHVRRAAARVTPFVEVFELGNYYPAGDEQVLVNEVTGRVVPEGGIPLAVGVVVDNVVTLSQIAAAVRDGRPVTHRPLTVAGAVRRALTCVLPIGTPLGRAVELAGGATVPDYAVIEGGPMMGRLVEGLEEPVTKKTSGVIVLPADHPLVRRRRAPREREARLARAVCCQCRMCTDLCPRFNLGHRLQPHLAMRALRAEGRAPTPPAHVTAAFLCSGCGVCEAYACPMTLSPRRVLDELRRALLAAGQRRAPERRDLVPHDFHTLRRVPLPRLVARLGLDEYGDAPHVIDLRPPEVARVRILLAQHTGAPARPVVAAGQTVHAGDLVADIPEGQLGARHHASIDGTVAQVDEHAITIARS